MIKTTNYYDTDKENKRDVSHNPLLILLSLSWNYKSKQWPVACGSEVNGLAPTLSIMSKYYVIHKHHASWFHK